MSTQRRKLYASSNGDCWYLCRGRDGQLVILHQQTAASAKKTAEVDLGTFLAKGNKGPEHQALRHLIGELVNPDYSTTGLAKR